MRRAAWCAALAALATLLWTASVLAEPLDGVVTGQVTNGTAGGTSVAGATVRLLVFNVSGQRQVDQRQTTVGPDGRYRFDGLDRDQQLAYFAIVQHQDVSYPAATPFQFGEQPEQASDVQVFDTTTSDAALRFDRVNLLVAAVDSGVLQVMQMGAVANTGDRTFVTANPQDGALARGLRFGLPRGAVGVQMETGFRDEDLMDAVGGVQVTAPVKPGRFEYAMSFEVPYTGSTADLALQLPYAAGTVNAYVPINGPVLRSGQLASQARSEMGGQTFQQYTANDLRPGTMLGAELTGLPWAGGTGLNPMQLAAVSLGVVLLILGAGMFLYVGRRGSAPATVDDGDAPASSPELEHERLQLVLRLAALDERFAAGDLGDEEYHAERDRGKQRLVRLTRAMRTDAVAP